MPSDSTLQKSSKAWVFYALAAGLCYGVGNIIFGLEITKHGIWGCGFTGPAPFLMLATYRLI